MAKKPTKNSKPVKILVGNVIPAFLDDLTARIRSARLMAVTAVNSELVRHY